MNARDVMTPDVVSVSPGASVAEMASLMLEKRISGLPVLDRAGNLVGIVTEGDCLRRAETGTERKRLRWLELLSGSEKLAQDYVRSHGRRVSDVMTKDPICVGEETPLDEIVHLMEARGIKRVPVVRDGKVVGIVSRANLLHALASLTRESGRVQQDDRTVREQVLAEFEKLPWQAKYFVNVVVKDGVVELWGSYLAASQDKAMIVAAENIPGVRCVRSHLSRVDPMSGLVVANPDDEKDRGAAAPAS